MLDCAPAGMADVGSAPYGHDWAMASDLDAMHVESLLLNLIATRKPRDHGTPAKPAARRIAQAPFQPERMSGYCAC